MEQENLAHSFLALGVVGHPQSPRQLHGLPAMSCTLVGFREGQACDLLIPFAW